MIGQPPRNRAPRTVMSALSGILVGSATIWGMAAAGAAPDVTRAMIRYELSGTGVAGYVTYQTMDAQDHATNVPLPWSTEFLGWMKDANTVASTYLVSAHGVGPGTLSCKVLVAGKVLAQNTATGDPARVLCETH